jgi:8-oxo-dGTP pyrophosphatase MutT (NUDIX family)
VGSVARAHLPRLADWPGWLRVDASGSPQVHLTAPADERDAALAALNAALRRDGLILAWRDEPFALFAPGDGRVLATLERAAARFWGTLTLGAHANGWVAGPHGRPSHLWIARRSRTKATDPGLLDNLIGGGVPHGQTPLQAVVREGWEEAGLTPAQMQGLLPGSVIELDRDVREGRQFERLHSYDLELPAGLVPTNQDGEVESLACLTLAEAAEAALGGQMTVDAALVTLDFLLRHDALPAPVRQTLAQPLELLRGAGWGGPGPLAPRRC